MKLIVVVDMQYDFIEGALGTKEAQKIVPIMRKKLQKMENPGNILIYTKDTHSENYLETQEGQNLPVLHCLKDSAGWCIHKDVRFLPQTSNFTFTDGKDVICKPSFGSLELMEKVMEINNTFALDEIILMGVCTDICVVSNALLLKAALPETLITVDASCCAGATPEKHQAALETMKSCQVNIIND